MQTQTAQSTGRLPWNRCKRILISWRLSRAFQRERVLQQDQLRNAVENADAPEIKRLAHLFRGVMETFAAAEAIAYAEQLESLGRSGRLDGVAGLHESLCQSLEEVDNALASFIENPQRYLNEES